MFHFGTRLGRLEGKMSRRVREWLHKLNLLWKTTSENRTEIDREIERRTGVNCDEAIARNLVSETEFLEIVNMILGRKKRKEAELMVV